MSETLSDTRLRLETIIVDNFPDIDIAPGTVFSELVVKMAAYLQNPIVNDIATLDQTSAISEVIAATDATFNPIIDAIASNYNTSRGQGTKSVGKIKVIVTQDRTYFIRAGATFFQPVLKLNYVVPTDYKALSNPVDVNDLKLIQEGALFYFVIPIEAEDVGPQYQVSDGSKFTVIAGREIVNFVDALAYGNFSTGLPLDDDKALIAKYQAGIANKSLLSSKSIKFRLEELYPNVRDVSVIGANDEEMTRSKQNLFGISTLGMADIYIRSCLGPETIRITKTATKTATDTWGFSLGVDDAAGFYRVISIIPDGEDVGGTLLNTQTFDFTVGGIIPANVVNNITEGRFTKYQTCDVVFTYTDDTAIAGTKDFLVLLSYQPNVADVQNLFLSNDERIACADYLVKAALPCYVSVQLVVHRKDPTVDLAVDQMKQDIYNYINSLTFGEDLYASALVDICHNYPVRYVEMPVKLAGDIFCNDSSILTITDTDFLEIPKALNVGVSNKTTLFFADYFKTSSIDNMSESIDIRVI